MTPRLLPLALCAGCAVAPISPYATEVGVFSPGEFAGFGQDLLPDVVLGAPQGNADGTPSLDVLSLGVGGELTLVLGAAVVDGPGPDLLVFENPMPAWRETAFVAVSEDGETWHEWPCDPSDEANDFPGCAGVGVVYAGPTGADPTDPEAAGGDAFDLADLGVTRATWVRVRDSGLNPAGGDTGGFDLDAVAAVNAER